MQPTSHQPLRIMVLAGGPDNERDISLQSGACVTKALQHLGHDVRQRDAGPNDLAALQEFKTWQADLAFPMMHGPWGEGGQLQTELEKHRIPYVGSSPEASANCMAKDITKNTLLQHGLPTPEFELLQPGQPATLSLPLVLKPLAEGSSFGVAICHTPSQLRDAANTLNQHHQTILAECYIPGDELTVGITATPTGHQPLPVIKIVPQDGHYDFNAKYTSQSTRYLTIPTDMGIPPETLKKTQALALKAFEIMGCRDLARVDFILGPDETLQILEINTIPGFTMNSLLPKAAAQVGITMKELTKHLIQAVLTRTSTQIPSTTTPD